mmetsp:Transcript_67170/g.160873  ORF Transcript_67170/g.160873 Transcript_67170/m.160873 type:complete len:205 (-) Transcript_67170:19-633(-)
MSAIETPSSSFKPFLLTSRDMQEVLFSIAFVNNRNRTEVSSMPQTVMCGALTFLLRVSRICSNPPSIFFLCSSSSRRFRSCSLRLSSCLCCSFFACCSRCRLMASSFSFSFRRFSACSFFLLRSSILRFCNSSVRFVFGRTDTGGLNLRVPRMSSSSSSIAAAMSSFGAASTSTMLLAAAASCQPTCLHLRRPTKTVGRCSPSP